MKSFEKHEQFEIEVLTKLKNNHLLQPLVFGGGTMLRLCYDLERYSADLDFWFIKPVSVEDYFNKIKMVLQNEYELTDAQIKHFTLLIEIKSSKYSRRLKIEIRKELRECDFQDRIAYSKFSNSQVLLRAHTLVQTMINKKNALIDRNEIRDAFDIEFMLRKGIELPEMSIHQKTELLKHIDTFKEQDFKVKLGSILTDEMRKYYIKNKFSLLKEKLH